MFDHPAAGDAIKSGVVKRHAHHVPGDVTGTGIFHAAPCSPQHLMRQVKRHKLRVGVCLLEKMAKNLTGSGADIQDASSTGDIELSSPQHASDERLMKRDEAPHREHGSAGTVVEFADVVSVLLKGCSPHALEF